MATRLVIDTSVGALIVLYLLDVLSYVSVDLEPLQFPQSFSLRHCVQTSAGLSQPQFPQSVICIIFLCAYILFVAGFFVKLVVICFFYVFYVF